ncbi:MAG: zf-HC2 domain-containing protein [Candidatus Eremiobacteraeota bacterium]|nr:zf-HC2 domain-containing protein [Candidatus Eremiobacteraeota bacterium]
MKCRKVEELSGRYIDGELLQADKKALEDHVLHCRACSSYIEEMKGVDTLVRNHDFSKPSDQYFINLVPRIHERIFSEEIKKRNAWGWLGGFSFKLAMGVTIIVVALFIGFLPRMMIQKGGETPGIKVPELSHVTAVPASLDTGSLSEYSNVYITVPDQEARIKNYLSNSEIVLIKLVAMPEKKENYSLLKDEVVRSGLKEQIESTMSLFKENPELLSHAKAMEILSIRIINGSDENYQEDLKLLKTQVQRSGLLEKTQSMKI